MNSPFAVALIALLGFAAWSDLRWRQIPNALAAGVALLWLAALASGVAGPAWSAVSAAAMVLAAGFSVWRCGWLGGGDVKLATALSLWATLDHLAPLLLSIGVAGGILAVGSLLAARAAAVGAVLLLRLRAGHLLPTVTPVLAALGSPRPASLPSLPSLPYGVAIALGGCWLVRDLLPA